VLKDRLQDALNSQVNAEIYSAYLYLSMSAYLHSTNLEGFAHWMRVQAQEELMHAMRFYDFVVARGGRVNLKPIAGPPATWTSPLAVFEGVMEHERKVTGLINDIVDMALDERDHATYSFLQWFVDEQVEEESTAEHLVKKLKLVGQDGSSVYLLDKELGQRVLTPAPSGTPR
jgi:ferritin